MTRIPTTHGRPAPLPARVLVLVAALAVSASAFAGGQAHPAWQAFAGSGPAVTPRLPATPQGGAVQLFTTLADFQQATAGWDLVFEDFSSRPPFNAAPCQEPANHEMGQPGTSLMAPVCFEPGVLPPGFSVRSDLGTGPHGYGMWAFGAGIGDLPVAVVGAQSPASATLVDFNDGVVAVAMDAFDWQAGTPLTFDVLGAGGRLLDSVTLAGTVPSEGVFAGFVSSEPIHRVEVRSLSGATQMIGNLRFGGQPGDYALAQEALHFGVVKLGGNNLISITLQQTGDLPVSMPFLSQPAEPFHVYDDGCSGQLLDVGDTCTLTYGFEPLLVRGFRQVVPLPLPDGSFADRSLLFTGRGAVSRLHLDTDELAFGDLPPGQQASAAVRLANFQAVPVEVHTISPQDGAFFELVGGAGNCPPVPFVLSPGESCQLEYLATSSGTQAQRARVLIHSHDPSSPRRLLLRLGIEDRIFSDGFEQIPH